VAPGELDGGVVEPVEGGTVTVTVVGSVVDVVVDVVVDEVVDVEVDGLEEEVEDDVLDGEVVLELPGDDVVVLAGPELEPMPLVSP
jgi:hypothetical protein